MITMAETAAIILAGGKGTRFKTELPKQFVKLAGKTVLEHTLKAFEHSELIGNIYVVVPTEYYGLANSIVRQGAYAKVRKILRGGATRQESSRVGVCACTSGEHNVTQLLTLRFLLPILLFKWQRIGRLSKIYRKEICLCEDRHHRGSSSM